MLLFQGRLWTSKDRQSSGPLTAKRKMTALIEMVKPLVLKENAVSNTLPRIFFQEN
jgi:hypothetical protein